MTNSTSLYSLPYKPKDIKNMTPGQKRKYGLSGKACGTADGEYDHSPGTKYGSDHPIGRDS